MIDIEELQDISNPIERVIKRKEIEEEINRQNNNPEDKAANNALRTSSYSDMIMPDSNSLELVRHILPGINERIEVNEEMKDACWSLISPNASATFDDESRRPDMDLKVNTLRIISNMSVPSCDITPERLRQWDNIYTEYENTFKRNCGAKDNKTNFLKLMFTHIQQVITTSTNYSGQNKPQGGGLLGIKKMFG